MLVMFLQSKKILTFKNLILIKFEITLLGNPLSFKLYKNQNQNRKYKKIKMIKRLMHRLARAILNLI